jgi:crotonobetaine/carnitine-CoA ligase
MDDDMTLTSPTTTRGRTLGDLLREEAALDPDRPFLKCASDWVTLSELDRWSDTVAAGLQSLGVEKGDRVGIDLPNCLEYVVLIYACAKLGVIQVPLNTYLKGEFLRHQLAQTEVSVLVSDGLGMQLVQPLMGGLPHLRQLVLVGDPPDDAQLPVTIPYAQLKNTVTAPNCPDIKPSDVCVIMYTSGTTGESKGCIITHGYYTFIAPAFISYGWCMPGDTVFGATPLFHFSGQVWLVAMALSARGSVVVEPQFSATTFMARAAEEGATVLFGMGAMAMAIMAQPIQSVDRNHRIRQASWIPMTVDYQQQFEDRFGISVISEVFGQSECWPATLSPVDGPRKPASLGRPIPGVQVRLVDEDDNEVPVGDVGEIIVRADRPGMLFEGYWANPEATLQTFRHLWHHTGDNAHMDEDGFLYFVDRKKDSLRRRGENVSSIELEQAIAQHPAVAQAAVLGVPSEMTEDEIKACVVLRPGFDPDFGDLFAFFKKSVPYYAVPRYIEILDELPANVNGRVQKFKLRERGITETTIDFEAIGLVVERHERRTS